jgi:rare lipoprotein A (peptidoglycan hydrolase)
MFVISSCTVVKVVTFPVKIATKIAVKTVEVTGKTTWKILTAPFPESETKGIASWYGPGFHGQRTASGEIYNMYNYTAAHKTLPLGTYVRVINLENDKMVIVRINDRGPFKRGRIIDLSYAAAKKIDMIASGTARVKLDIISKP